MDRSIIAGRFAVGVVSCFGFAFSLLLFFYAAGPWVDHSVIPTFGTRICDTAVFGLIGLSCIFVSIRLIQGKTWAWWVALLVGIVMLGMGGRLLLLALYPRDDFARSEGGYGLVLSLFFLLPGALSLILLCLPFVRRRFFISPTQTLA